MFSTMCKHLLLLLAFVTSAMLSLGCGSNVAPGVADAPDEPAPVMTEEEQNTEAESARNAAGQGEN
jgi:hypothetical protein